MKFYQFAFHKIATLVNLRQSTEHLLHTIEKNENGNGTAYIVRDSRIAHKIGWTSGNEAMQPYTMATC